MHDMKTALPPRTFAVQRSNQRYFADHGWLRTYHSFSFAEYFDPSNVGWGALRVFNDDWIAAGSGFPMHSHSDMEILTYVLSGELEHQDSIGNRGIAGPGGVQFMSAGTGVRHSESNARDDRELHLVQMWVLPGKLGVQPSYGQIDFTEDDRRNRWLAVASGEPSVESSIALTQRATLRVARLENHELRHTFEPQRFGFLFVADGKIVAGSETLEAGDAVRTYAIERLHLRGSGEVVFWDVPEV